MCSTIHVHFWQAYETHRNCWYSTIFKFTDSRIATLPIHRQETYRIISLCTDLIAWHAVGTGFESGARHTEIINASSNFSYTECSAFEVKVAGRSDGTLNLGPCHCRWDTKRIPRCSMIAIFEHNPIFQALHRQNVKSEYPIVRGF